MKTVHVIIGAVPCSEHSDIRYLNLITGNVQKFVSVDKNGFRE